MNDMVTTQYDVSAFDEAAESIQGASEPTVRFIKSDWYFNDGEKIEIPRGTMIVGNVFEAVRGWIRFGKDEQGKTELAERRVGKVADRYQPEPREALGFDDQSKWETDDKGNPQDPWAATIEFPAILIGAQSNHRVVCAGTSKGYHGAMKRLFQAFSKQSRMNPGKAPVIELGRTHYDHAKWGLTHSPTLTVADSEDEVEIVKEEPKQVAQKKRAMF
jgi:hypothetical protein